MAGRVLGSGSLGIFYHCEWMQTVLLGCAQKRPVSEKSCPSSRITPGRLSIGPLSCSSGVLWEHECPQSAPPGGSVLTGPRESVCDSEACVDLVTSNFRDANSKIKKKKETGKD